MDEPLVRRQLRLYRDIEYSKEDDSKPTSCGGLSQCACWAVEAALSACSLQHWVACDRKKTWATVTYPAWHVIRILQHSDFIVHGKQDRERGRTVLLPLL